MPRKRKKRRPNWGPILWLALIVNVGAGLWFSPITEVRRLRIEGAPEWDRGRLALHAQMLSRESAVSVDPRKLESLALSHSALKGADLRRSLFGSATLKLNYREPVARVLGAHRTFLSPEGVLFQSPSPAAGLPTLKLHPSALKASLTLTETWPAARIAALIRRVPKALQEKLEVEVDSEGAVCLNTSLAARILLGSADRLEEKFRTLEGLLAERPGLLRQVKEINLIEPSQPVWKSRTEAKP